MHPYAVDAVQQVRRLDPQRRAVLLPFFALECAVVVQSRTALESRRVKFLGTAIVAAALSVLMLFFAGEYYAADICLDAGQVYDYGTSQCRADVDHLPYVPYVKNVRWGVILASVALPLGIWFVFIGRRRRP